MTKSLILLILQFGPLKHLDLYWPLEDECSYEYSELDPDIINNEQYDCLTVYAHNIEGLKKNESKQ